MSKIEFSISPDFDPYKAKDFLEERGWNKVELVPVSNYNLRPTDKGAALECADGRSDFINPRKYFGPSVFGALNAFAALKTGGDYPGFLKAAQLAKDLGYNPGTHGDLHKGGGCGLFNLWVRGKLESAVGDFALPIKDLSKDGIELSQWIKAQMRMLGGIHFTLPGNHEEKGVIINPFLHTTEATLTGQKFKQADWLLGLAGVEFNRRMLFAAEAVEQLKKDALNAEIMVLKAA